MSRYFVDASQINDKSVIITGEDYQHLKKVLRVDIGDPLVVCCNGFDYNVTVESILNDKIVASIIEKSPNVTESRLKITLFQGLPKQDKMELVIQKCVELGITEIIPVITKRCVTKINSDKDAQSKVARWQKIALEASKQSNRGIIPRIGLPIRFEEALEAASKMDLAIIPYEKEKLIKIKDVISKGSAAVSAAIFIGPEGGFEEQEINSAELCGVQKVTLGPRILRTETAGLFVVSILMYELGDV